ncbi:DUF6074 family protein [Ciceribacter azotifigens]|uniref:DUF6074 family protein n=1 Tax=Ciceribacter azotifigens TaxID=2069303 RepID=UPI003A8B77A2
MTVIKTEYPAATPKVAFFPLRGRRALIRRCARELDERNGEAAVTYWRTTCRGLGAKLLEQGCPEPEMRRQILDFQDMVQQELQWLHCDDRRQGRADS